LSVEIVARKFVVYVLRRASVKQFEKVDTTFAERRAEVGESFVADVGDIAVFALMPAHLNRPAVFLVSIASIWPLEISMPILRLGSAQVSRNCS